MWPLIISLEKFSSISDFAAHSYHATGNKQDYAQARIYFEKAADQGFTFAQVHRSGLSALFFNTKQVNLGNMYQQGLGCEKDLKKALHYYGLASGENKHAEGLMKSVQEKVC